MFARHHLGRQITIVVLALTGGVLTACYGEPREESSAPGARADLLANGAAGHAGGLAWTTPATWQPIESDAMRAASYRVFGEGGDADADMSVSHFPGSGGGQDANIQRWVGQFRAPGGGPLEKVKRGHKRIADFFVATLDVAGTYQGGPSSKSGPLEGYRLLAAIVQAPEGPVFFKLTGPDTTVTAAAEGFQAMLESMRLATED